ncbi:MAG: hypothetical protein Q9185_004941 [Variospora sp. 1 TL-2023]
MDKTVGVLGGGQLGRMLTEVANRLNIKIVTLDAENAPAKQVNANPLHIRGSFSDPDAIRRLADQCEVITVEIEHVDTCVLEEISRGIRSPQRVVQPSWRTIRTIQDKFLQKEHLQSNDIPTVPSKLLNQPCHNEELEEVGEELGYPFMLKSRTEAYDGRGNYPVLSAADIPDAMAELQNRPLYAEKWTNFRMELAVMVVKMDDATDDTWQKSTLAYPVVETIHEESVCKLVYALARSVSGSVLGKAQELAQRAVATFWGRGVFGVEMFLLEDDEILVNEIAPRPHNSGHYTIEACPLSQYEAHLRAILGLPIPPRSVKLLTKNTNAIMLNLLGGSGPKSHLKIIDEAYNVPSARIHLYGKGDARPRRKMGHVTVVADSMDEAASQIEPLVQLANLIRAEKLKPQSKATRKEGQGTDVEQQQNHPTKSKSPLVAVTMGSKSDSSVLAPGIKLLEQLGVPTTVTITSAHRTPEKMMKFAQDAAAGGIKVIIAAAGQPPKHSSNARMSNVFHYFQVKRESYTGADPQQRGCPVATVAINNSVNAAQLAVRILATDNARMDVRKRLEQHLADQTKSVLEDSDKMERLGFEAFCSQG